MVKCHTQDLLFVTKVENKCVNMHGFIWHTHLYFSNIAFQMFKTSNNKYLCKKNDPNGYQTEHDQLLNFEGVLSE